MRTSILTACLSLSLLSMLPGQGAYRAVPKPLTDAFGNLEFYGGAARMPVRSQWWCRGDNLPPVLVINRSSLRLGPVNPSSKISYKLVLKLDNTMLGPKSLSRNLDSNLSTNAVVVFNNVINQPVAGPAKSPNENLGWVPYARPFLFTRSNTQPNNLLLDADRSGPSPSNAVFFIDGLSMPSAGFFASNSRQSCGGTLTASHNAGNIGLAVSGAPASSPTIVLVGTETVSAGSQRLPISLNALGMNGCILGLVPSAIVPLGSTDTSGNLSVRFPLVIPSQSSWVNLQAVHTTTANRAGLATTNVANCILGNSGLITVVSATAGPYAYNHGVVRLFD